MCFCEILLTRFRLPFLFNMPKNTYKYAMGLASTAKSFFMVPSPFSKSSLSLSNEVVALLKISYCPLSCSNSLTWVLITIYCCSATVKSRPCSAFRAVALTKLGTLVSSIHKHHIDPCRRRPGKSVYHLVLDH